MKNTSKLAIVAVLAVAVAATLALRGAKRAEYSPVTPVAPVALAPASVATPAPAAPAARPRLLELGSLRCQACLEMAKVLEALRESQGGRLQVDFIDVFEQPDAPEAYRISVIPTQILYDGTGREIFRHTGFFSHDDILAKFGELGVGL